MPCVCDGIKLKTEQVSGLKAEEPSVANRLPRLVAPHNPHDASALIASSAATVPQSLQRITNQKVAHYQRETRDVGIDATDTLGGTLG